MRWSSRTANEDLAIIFSEALQSRRIRGDPSSPMGKVALEQLRAIQPAVIVLDLHLPPCTGRSDPGRDPGGGATWADTGVVIATADPQMADELQDRSDLVLAQARELSTSCRMSRPAWRRDGPYRFGRFPGEDAVIQNCVWKKGLFLLS
ncbi:MAG: hypothetical protein U5L04_07245 [Trueperaceae bacterium]|nr:hypothetical protein [Trueperaceae bacterium]